MKEQTEQAERAKNLRTKLFHSGIRVQEAASRLDVTRQHLGYVLNGHRPSKELLDRLEQMLEQQPDPEFITS